MSTTRRRSGVQAGLSCPVMTVNSRFYRLRLG